MAGLNDGQPVLTAGEPLKRASAAMLLVHGRGASADDILLSCRGLLRPGFAFMAPQAAGNAWYPNRFMEPLETNEPWLGSALDRLAGLLDRITKTVPASRVILLGFSQGACLALEFGARNARRYGGLVGLSGGLIGPDDTPRDYSGSLAGTPVVLGCSDVDPHIPAQRVIESGEILTRLGGEVTVRLYPGMGHQVNQDELELVSRLMAALPRRDDIGEAASGRPPRREPA